MTESFLNRNARQLILAFGGIVTVASVLAITLPCGGCSSSSSSTTKKPLGPEKKTKTPPGPPRSWTDEQLKTYLAEQYVYLPEGVERERIVELVETYINRS